MEHPPPPPPPRAGLANGHPGEMPFYHPPTPPRESMPYPESMHYPHQMDPAHGSQRFAHSQEGDRFQPVGQWGHAQMRPGASHEGQVHAREGYGEPGHQGGAFPQQAEHGAGSTFQEGQDEGEGHPQGSQSDAEGPGAGNEPRDQKNVHSDWSSLADEPMDFGQAPAFAEVTKPLLSGIFQIPSSMS